MFASILKFWVNRLPIGFKFGRNFLKTWDFRKVIKIGIRFIIKYKNLLNQIIWPQYNEFLRKLHFYTFLGVNITFAPTHILSIVGLPGRVPDYPTIYASTNNLPTFGHILSIFSLLIFL